MHNRFAWGILILSIIPSSIFSFKLGIHNIPDSFKKSLTECSLGLLTDQFATDESGVPSQTYLEKQGLSFNMVFRVEQLANGSTLRKLSEVQTLVVDIADFGMRNSQSLLALVNLLCIASQANTQVIILDRPNLMGYRMEGPLVEAGRRSEHAPLPIPLRHGMTVGELAWFCNMHYLARPIRLHVIQMTEYDRREHNISPICSPSLLHMLAHVSPISIEGSNLRLPVCGSDADWNVFNDALDMCGITTVIGYSDQSVTCAFSLSEPNQGSLFKAALYVCDFLKAQSIPLRTQTIFNDIVGTQLVQSYIDNLCDYQMLATHINDGLAYFFKKARSAFMYTPLPLITELTEHA